MALFRNFNNSGKGISKDEVRNKKGVGEFFKTFGRKFWELIGLNMLYMCFYIPLAVALFLWQGGFNWLVLLLIVVSLFLIGPATGGMFKILRNFVLEEPCFMIHAFFKEFRTEYLKNFVWGVIDVVMGLSVYCAIKIYPTFFNSDIVKYAMLGLNIFLGVIVLFMNFYYFLLNSATDLNLRDTIKDSFILVNASFKKCLLTGFLCILVWGLIILALYIMQAFWLLFFFPATFVGLIITYNSYPIIQKYVINPYYRSIGEINPEISFAMAKDVAVFEDMGGKEKPIVIDKKIKKSRTRGKDIS